MSVPANSGTAIALVTGGGGGLGAALAMAFGRRGVAVVLVDLDEGRAMKVAEDVRLATSVGTLAIGADITVPAEIARVWELATSRLGPIDILVNAAGAFTSTDYLKISIEQWKRTLDLQLTAPFLLCQSAVRDWILNGNSGVIVNVASTAAVMGKTTGSADYSASKAGLLGLTIDLAVEFGPLGIRTNAVLPHSFLSPMNSDRLADPTEEARSRSIVPLKRIASADEVASTIIFLALDGTYLNGVLLPCDGGVTVSIP